MNIQVNNTGIRIRPSSIDNFVNCPLQWAKVFLEGRTSIPGARAAIGTSIHKAAEVLWSEAIKQGKVDDNVEKLTDAAVEEFAEIEKKDKLYYDPQEDTNTAQDTIVKGVRAFVEDIVPFTPIPLAVEQFLEIPISGNPIINAIGGTIDYLTDTVVADVKTSRRKAVMHHYTTQQSVYKYLAQSHGYNIEHSLIQNVILRKTSTEGLIGELTPNVEQAKFIVNKMLETMEIVEAGTIPLNVLFRGNPKYYLCSEKYCAFFNECDWVKGEAVCQKRPVL
jgi:hypothetical protein